MSPATSADGAADPAAPHALPPADAAVLLGISTSHFFALAKSGKLGPLPVRLGRAVRYRRQELIEWLDAGCPPRHRWQAMRTGKR